MLFCISVLSNKPDWCKCGNCREHFAIERHCCSSSIDQPCVLQSDTNLRNIVLNEAAVTTAINACNVRLHERQWRYANNEMRYAAYRQYVFYKLGHLGKSVRVCPPSCVLWAIRDMWPAAEGEHYSGFKA
jgi:hypothetical protein